METIEIKVPYSWARRWKELLGRKHNSKKNLKNLIILTVQIEALKQAQKERSDDYMVEIK